MKIYDIEKIESARTLFDSKEDYLAELFNRENFIPEKHLDLNFLKANDISGFFKFLNFHLLFDTFGYQIFNDDYMQWLEQRARLLEESWIWTQQSRDDE